jgi:hypothetical protein
MDHIDEHLATAALNPDYPLAIKAALAVGKATLNRYYNKTDHSEVYRIAMGTVIPLIQTWVNSFLPSFFSPTPSTQAGLLQESGMGASLDRQGKGDCSCRIRAVL